MPSSDTLQETFLRLAREDPQLAGRLFVTALPASAAAISGRLRFRLDLEDVGTYDVAVLDGQAQVIELSRVPDHVTISTGRVDRDQETLEQPAVNGDRRGDGSVSTELIALPNGKVDFELRCDPVTLARLGSGKSPLGLMVSGKLKLRGKRRRALRLRQLATDLSMREVARAGVEPDPELLYRALPYSIEAAWTRGHSFCISYVLLADEYGDGGRWFVIVDDGRVTVAGEPPVAGVDSHVSMYHETWLQILRGDLAPGDAMRRRLTQVEGKMFPVTLFGRWIERSQGRDDIELARELRQRELQDTRATWGSRGGADDAQDPAQRSKGRAPGPSLLSYEELYALWERQNWKAHEIDFSVDKKHWLATPTDGQRDTLWSLSSFYVGEERVAADLAPFVMAAPSGEIEVFLATQLVDEARHAAFFDRFMAEVMAVEPDDMRARLASLEFDLSPPWKEMFDHQLRDIAGRIQDHPDDLDLFVEGVVTYHLVIEGVLAMTGQHQILKYMNDHDIYPGFREGFSLVERDEHRHIAFGVRFLSDAVEAKPDYKDLITWKIGELVPQAVQVFVPPGVDDPSDFMSYDYHSSEIYGFAYRALKRRMKVIGIEIQPADELMPGPIDQPAVASTA